VKAIAALGVALALSGCAATAPGRMDWTELPEFWTETTVFFDRGKAKPTDSGWRVDLVTQHTAYSASRPERAVIESATLDVGRNGGPWTIEYRVEGTRPVRVYRSIGTSWTDVLEDRGAHRLSGHVSATMVERLYGVDHPGGTIRLEFDVPIE
jgi:hypothetical protein